MGWDLQTDGYSAYDDIGGPKLVHVGYWAHARRKFVDAVKVNQQDAAAILSVVESCRRLSVPRKSYFTAVLPGLNRRTLSEVANLTPARWSATRA